MDHADPPTMTIVRRRAFEMPSHLSECQSCRRVHSPIRLLRGRRSIPTRFGFDMLHTTIRGLLGVALSMVGLGVEAGPVPPCSAMGSAVVPLYAELGNPPTIAIWHDVELGSAEPCLGAMPGRMKLVVALAGRFRSTHSIEQIAGRVGAVSSTRGLRYFERDRHMDSSGDWGIEHSSLAFGGIGSSAAQIPCDQKLGIFG